MIAQVEFIVAVRGDDEDVMEDEARAFIAKSLTPEQIDKCEWVEEWEGDDGAICYKYRITF